MKSNSDLESEETYAAELAKGALYQVGVLKVVIIMIFASLTSAQKAAIIQSLETASPSITSDEKSL